MPNLEETLIEEFMGALRSLPDVKADFVERESSINEKAIDAIIKAHIQGKPVQLAIEVKSNGYPRDVEYALSTLTRFQKNADGSLYSPIFIAPAITESSRENLRQQGIGYWDRSGSLYIKLPGTLFFIDRPQPPAVQREVTTIYRGANSQVVHALLNDPDRRWHGAELAEEAKVSEATVHRVLTSLEKQALLVKYGSGPNTARMLTNPGALLDAWANVHTLEEYEFHRFYKWTQSIRQLRENISQALDNRDIRNAVTLATGASLVAPFITGVDKVYFLIEETVNMSLLTEYCKMKPVKSGDNINFLVVPNQGPLLFRQKLHLSYVASNIQLYLDLYAWPMRGKEQAQHLREELLPF